MITEARPLLLGSGSPRRRELIGALGLPYLVRGVELEEAARPGESPARYVRRVVLEKLEAVTRVATEEGLAVGATLVADTEVLLDGTVLGKPADTVDALRLLRRLAGRTHEVLTCYAVAPELRGVPAARFREVVSRVTFRSADDSMLRAYAESGEGLDKAGAYALQGLGAFLVERVEGSPSGVIGLPVCELVTDLQAWGLLGRFP